MTEIRRHYFRSGDWISPDRIALCRVACDWTNLCERNGDGLWSNAIYSGIEVCCYSISQGTRLGVKRQRDCNTSGTRIGEGKGRRLKE